MLTVSYRQVTSLVLAIVLSLIIINQTLPHLVVTNYIVYANECDNSTCD